MTGSPAATLLHLGPGLGNGWANLHNARKARSGIVNIVGDHATGHVPFESPLKSDLAGIAGSISHWVRSSQRAADVGADGAAAVKAARDGAVGRIATLALPADTAWGAGGVAHAAPLPLPWPLTGWASRCRLMGVLRGSATPPRPPRVRRRARD
jgi:acetolactate synthase-1/2/3 large subunit